MTTTSKRIKLGLPKGRMQDGVLALLAEAGIQIRVSERSYRPKVSLDGVDAKILKPHNIIGMLDAGARDIGFGGADWVAELGADVVEIFDTELDPVRLVAAAPSAILEDGRLPSRPLVIASEYERITRRWIADQGIDARFLRTYGATEVFPPDDADCIVDVTATGSTLRSNQLDIVADLLRSSTRLYASRHAMEDPDKRAFVEELGLLLGSVLEARRRALVEVNVTAEYLDAVVDILPCMREPTVSPLHHDVGFAVRAAVPRRDLPTLIPAIRAAGGTDIVVTSASQIVP